jgi:hypothetical protein
MSSKLSRCSSSILIIVSQYLNSLFNYNNLTIILITMIEREVETYIEAREFGEGDISEEK